LRLCVKYGKTVLIENIGEDLDSALITLISSEVMENQTTKPIEVFMDNQYVEIARGFKFYLFSELAKPNFPNFKVIHCNILNFSLSYEALES